MGAIMKLVEYTLPSYWNSALINGDYSGLEDYEIVQIEALIEDVIDEVGHAMFLDCTEEPCFLKYHDAMKYGVLAADCLIYTIEDRNHTK
jgi:hypothetical protein